MNFCISHISAAQFWIWASRLDPNSNSQLLPTKLLAQERTHVIPKPTFTKKQTATFASSHELTGPLDLLVARRGQRRKTAGYRFHFQGSSLDSNRQLVPLPDGNLVCSPALCLAQLASVLDPIDLTLLAFEFCGEYVLDPSKERGFSDRPHLTTVEEIRSVCGTMKGARGILTLRNCCANLVDGSRSPRETGLCAAFTKAMYGFPTPQLNYQIKLGEKAQTVYGKNSCICDLYWPGLDVEYDSDAEHAGSSGGAHDSLRAAALAFEGVEVVHLYSKNLSSINRLDAAAKLIGKKLGCSPNIAHGEERLQAAEIGRKLLGHHSHPF